MSHEYNPLILFLILGKWRDAAQQWAGLLMASNCISNSTDLCNTLACQAMLHCSCSTGGLCMFRHMIFYSVQFTCVDNSQQDLYWIYPIDPYKLASSGYPIMQRQSPSCCCSQSAFFMGRLIYRCTDMSWSLLPLASPLDISGHHLCCLYMVCHCSIEVALHKISSKFVRDTLNTFAMIIH